jgi:hypothetical protein
MVEPAVLCDAIYGRNTAHLIFSGLIMFCWYFRRPEFVFDSVGRQRMERN